VLLWGDAEAKRVMKGSERYDWEDIITVCLRMGSLPIIVLPNGDVSFSGGGGSAALVADPTKKKETKVEDQPLSTDLEAFRRAMMIAGGSRNVPMVEQAPFATTSDRLAKIINLVEKHVLAAPVPDLKATESETTTSKEPKKKEEE
jgi:hypothetical protein